MCRTSLLLLIMFFLHTFSVAQKRIRGTVIDSNSRQHLASAYIEEKGNPQSRTLSDADGHFSLFIKNNQGELKITFVGYHPIQKSIDKPGSYLIEMVPDKVNLKDLTIVAGNQTNKFSRLAKIDLDLKPVRNTQELMRLVPGLFIAQHAGGGKAEQIFLRGFDCDHGTDIQVTVDGLPVNMVSHAHGQGYADAHFLIPETINNINYGLGPYYTDHGNLNKAGYINFSTYDKIDKSKVQLEGGLFNTIRALAMVDLLKKNKDKESAYIASDFYFTDGPTDNKQNFNRFNLFGKYHVSISNSTQAIASLSIFKSKWDASGQIPTRAIKSGLLDRFGSIDPTEGGNTERINANILLNHRFSDRTSWENQFYYTNYVFNLYSNFTFYLKDTIHGDEINQAESRNLTGYQTKLMHNNYFDNGNLTSTFGAGFRYDATDSTRLAHVAKREFLQYLELGRIQEGNAFGWWEEQVQTGKWHINAGVRFDYLHFTYIDELAAQKPAQGKSIVSPKLNIEYTINPNIQLYTKIGKGFHSNDSRVVVSNSGYEILPAAYGADLGIILKPFPQLWLNATAWYLYLQQEFIYNGDDGNIEPSGKTSRKGIDIVARYQLNNNLFTQFNFNYSYAKALDEPKDNDYVPLAPRFTSTGGIYYKARRGLEGGISYRYMSDRPANENNSMVAKGYLVVDGSINFVQPKYEVGIAMENILNTPWNEAQFATTSRLKNEPGPVTDLNFTPGTPFFLRLKMAWYF
ncbi:MAG TPA: TonB-dependent receptor plug domain-containing protein [Puia sp.]|nr:TonB-dependent receptor plug domain-containing protein [Puia sp.]